MRWLALLIVAAGCSTAVQNDSGITADLACEGARLAVLYRTKPPSPAPAPPPESDACENCNGTGRIGDGKIIMTCPECRGTGKKARSVLCNSGTCRP